MINEIQNLLNTYLTWLKDKTILKQLDGWIEITTPYLDRHNDYLQIYVKRDDGGFLLTDDSYIISDLRLSGCDIDSKKRSDLLHQALNGFGVKLEGDAMLIKATADNFALKKHNLVQAMLAVNDLFYLAKPMVGSLFMEDVATWLSAREIRYIPKVKFTGKTGYDHVFNFVIPQSKKYPERILEAINRPDRNNIQSLAFSWIDTKNERPGNSIAYALLNDFEQSPSPAIMDALKNYEIKPVLWSEREVVKEELAA